MMRFGFFFAIFYGIFRCIFLLIAMILNAIGKGLLLLTRNRSHSTDSRST